jgi:hypothetical protein
MPLALHLQHKRHCKIGRFFKLIYGRDYIKCPCHKFMGVIIRTVLLFVGLETRAVSWGAAFTFAQQARIRKGKFQCALS